MEDTGQEWKLCKLLAPVYWNWWNKTQCSKTIRQQKEKKISFQGDGYNAASFFPSYRPKSELKLVSAHEFFTSQHWMETVWKKEDQEAACGGGKQKMTPQKQGTELALTPASLLKHDFSWISNAVSLPWSWKSAWEEALVSQAFWCSKKKKSHPQPSLLLLVKSSCKLEPSSFAKAPGPHGFLCAVLHDVTCLKCLGF